jgi:hypothetical protein
MRPDYPPKGLLVDRRLKRTLRDSLKQTSVLAAQKVQPVPMDHARVVGPLNRDLRVHGLPANPIIAELDELLRSDVASPLRPDPSERGSERPAAVASAGTIELDPDEGPTRGRLR